MDKQNESAVTKNQDIAFMGSGKIVCKSGQGIFLTTFGGTDGMLYLVVMVTWVYMIVKPP